MNIDFRKSSYSYSNATCSDFLDYGMELVNKCLGKFDDYGGGSGSGSDNSHTFLELHSHQCRELSFNFYFACTGRV